jgi:hypothetical protein
MDKPWIQASKETELLKVLDLLHSTPYKYLFLINPEYA